MLRLRREVREPPGEEHEAGAEQRQHHGASAEGPGQIPRELIESPPGVIGLLSAPLEHPQRHIEKGRHGHGADEAMDERQRLADQLEDPERADDRGPDDKRLTHRLARPVQRATGSPSAFH